MNLDDKFKQLFKGILIPAYIWQKKENKLVLIDYNNTVEENTDGQIEDYIGVKAEEFYKDQTIVLENLNRCFNEKKSFISEIEITHKFIGEKKFILFKFDFIPPDLVIVYENDITDYKLKKLELEKSEKKYNTLISYMTDVFWTKDLQGNAIYVSPNVVNILGFTPEEIIQNESEQIWFGRLHPDDVEKIKEAYIALFEKNSRFDVEYRIKRKDGEWIWLRDITDIIYEKDGVKYTDGVFFDITERKLAESKLRETEEKYKALVFNIPSVAWTSDYEGQTTFISPNIEKIYGFSPEEIYVGDGEEVWFGRIHPEDADRVRESYNALFEKNEVYDNEYRIKGKDGKWIWFQDTANIVYEKNGGLFADGVLSDVTDRKKAEIALKESEEKFRLLFKNMVAGFAYNRVVFDENDNPIDYIFVEVNDAFEEIIGLKKENFINRKISEFSPYITNSEFNWSEIYGEISKTGREKKFEQYISSLDRWYSVTAYSSERGYFSTIFSDITEKKKAEEKLKESEERYRLITENVNDLILVVNKEYTLEYVNEKAFNNILGYSKEDLIGKSVIENIHPNDVKKCMVAIKKGITDGETSVKLRVRDKNGIYHRFEFSGGWFRDIDGLRKGFLVGREISEKKPPELKLDVS